METTEIKLNKGFVVIIDSEDYSLISKYSWVVCRNYNMQYALAHVYKPNGKRTTLPMHRLILGLTDSKTITDHINSNGLDNRKENLRVCSASENGHNRGKPNNNTTGFKGVTWHKRDKKWQGYIMSKGKNYWLGYFPTAKEAHKTYIVAAVQLHGDFANHG